ncbi:MAG: hypothetical protein OEQ18_13515, partial [Gammaproteobacteria bacterium]|nr:hypothetical protein [Gammaproteobacteria bacterium]
MKNLQGIAVIGYLLVSGCGQQVEPPNAAATNLAAGLTAWGHPNLQGVYTFATTTPLERPAALADKATFTPDEIAEREAAAQARRQADVHDPAPGTLGSSYDAFWTENERGRLLARTSLITEPANGRLPLLTANGQAILDRHVASMAERTYGEAPFTKIAYRTWTDLPPYERCVARPIPRIFQAYNHGAQILQTPDHVVLHYESMHDARIIPLDGRPPLHDDIRFWNGDTRGHWEGDTLVVETSNFGKQTMDGGLTGPPLQFPMDNMRITERFRRIDANTLSY